MRDPQILTETEVDEIAFAICHGTPWAYICDDYNLTQAELVELLQTRTMAEHGIHKPKTPKTMSEAQTDLDGRPVKVRKVGRYWYVHIEGQTRPAVRAELFVEAILWADILTKPYERKAA